jgi:hypothetical protein
MSFSIGNLTAYVDQTGDLIKKAILKGETASIVKVQGGIKNSATINTLGSTLYAQLGACGWNASGTTNLAQRTISVCDLKVNESLCLNTLEDYYTSTMMNPGSYNENIPFEQIFAEDKADQINALIDDIFWRGDTVTGTGNLSLCNGVTQLLEKTSASASTVQATSVTAFTASNAIAAVDAIVTAIPEAIMNANNLVMFMSYSNFRIYATALRNANLFHFNGTADSDFSITVPGTNVKVKAVRGLSGVKRIYCSTADNFYLGTDLLNDAESFKITYNPYTDEVQFLAKWKMGVQVAFPDLIAYASWS